MNGKDPLTLALAEDKAGQAVVNKAGVTLLFDGLLPFLNAKQLAEIKKMNAKGAETAAIYAKLLKFTRSKLDTQTIIFYDDVSPSDGVFNEDVSPSDGEGSKEWLDRLTQDTLHGLMGYAARSAEGTGALHGHHVNLVDGRIHQIPVHIVATGFRETKVPYELGGRPSRKGPWRLTWIWLKSATPR